MHGEWWNPGNQPIFAYHGSFQKSKLYRKIFLSTKEAGNKCLLMIADTEGYDANQRWYGCLTNNSRMLLNEEYSYQRRRCLQFPSYPIFKQTCQKSSTWFFLIPKSFLHTFRRQQLGKLRPLCNDDDFEVKQCHLPRKRRKGREENSSLISLFGS